MSAISKRPNKHFILALPVYTQQLCVAASATLGLSDHTGVLRSVGTMATTGCHDEPFRWRDDQTTVCADW